MTEAAFIGALDRFSCLCAGFVPPPPELGKRWPNLGCKKNTYLGKTDERV